MLLEHRHIIVVRTKQISTIPACPQSPIQVPRLPLPRDASTGMRLATGHYAIADRGALFRGRGPAEDQSYFCGNRSRLVRRSDPRGRSHKEQERGPSPGNWIGDCGQAGIGGDLFRPDDNYVAVLEQHLPADAPALVPGPLVTTSGE